MDINPIEDILKAYSITAEKWEALSKNSYFQKVLIDQTTAWNGALNTHERVKLKSATLIEEWLPEANGRLHDREESLSAKVELGKLIARLADMGLGKAGIAGESGEKVTIQINLGADTQLRFEKEAAPKIIDVTPNPQE